MRCWPVLAAALLLIRIGPDAIHANQVDCGFGAPFVGRPVTTPKLELSRYMMVSAYHLEPYSDAYLENVLTDLARHDVSGIVYGTLGATSTFLRAQGSALDETALNQKIYSQAKKYGAKLWLQLRIYDNQLAVVKGVPRNVTAEEILNQVVTRAAFTESLRDDFAIYNRQFADACVVIMFEEAGIYHAPGGGGTFWSSSARAIGKPTESYDRMFADRLGNIFEISFREIKSANPKCSVGMHIGHSALNDRPVLETMFDTLAVHHAKPDFVFYDFYLKAQPNEASYARLLSERAEFITEALHLPALHLAQLHTMNGFQHGLGKTPSRSEIDDIIRLDERLGFHGIGFYNKNAVPTVDFDNGPFAPNTIGQATVMESSKDRWDYGMLKLFETEGIDFRHRFDLVFDQPGAAPQRRVLLRNAMTGTSDVLGVIGGNVRSSGGLTIFRGIDSHSYLADGRRLEIEFVSESSRDSGGVGGAVRLFLIPSEPVASFRTADSLAGEIASSGKIAEAAGEALLESGQASVSLCTR